MKKYILLSVVFCFVFDIHYLTGQPDDVFISTLKNKLSTWCESVPFEDIFIHSDRDTYIAGEYLWFNTYLFNRQTLSLSSGSSYAYVELLDPENKPVAETKVRLGSGSGGGGFRLPDSLGNGDYTLRGYTNQMKNFLPNGCFMKSIKVFNPMGESLYRKKTAVNFSENSLCKIALFPEGGRLLNGFVNKVGVRVFHKNGQKKPFNGFLSDEKNDTIASVSVDSTGIGSFSFFAVGGKVYKLVSDDRRSTVFLPFINQSGFTIKINDSAKDSLRVTVNMEGVSGAGINYFYIVIQSRGNFLYGTRVDFSGKSIEHTIAEDKLKPGINLVSLFDFDGNLVCNRLIFKPIPVSGNNILKTSGKMEKRGMIRLEIDLDTNLISYPDFSGYSISVAVKEKGNSGTDISDYLVTGSEFMNIDGTAEINAGDLFRMPEEKIDDYLLSIRSTWIKWEDIIHGKKIISKYLPENGRQFLSGFYKNRNNPEANNKMLFLSIPGKIPVFKYSVTDNENRFVFSIPDRESSGEYVIQPADVDIGYSLQIESPFSEKYSVTGYYNDSLNNEISNEVIRWGINYQVEKIYGISHSGDTISTFKSNQTPVRFYGKPDQELIMSDYLSLPAMQEVFFELIPGVSVKTNKSKYGIYIQDQVTRNYYDKLPALLVDGVIVNDPSVIINLDPDLVEKIDVIKGEYIVGDVFFSGIISVITKAGDFSNVLIPSNAIRIRNNSFDFVRSFISPDYSSLSEKSDRTPDFRNTLYWNHNLKPDKGGKITIDLATSDFVSDYEINLQGAAGTNLFSIKKTISIK